jgi:hypothetical protein
LGRHSLFPPGMCSSPDPSFLFHVSVSICLHIFIFHSPLLLVRISSSSNRLWQFLSQARWGLTGGRNSWFCNIVCSLIKNYQIHHIWCGRIQAEHMDALRDFIISEGRNPNGPCGLWHMQYSCGQGTNRADFLFKSFGMGQIPGSKVRLIHMLGKCSTTEDTDHSLLYWVLLAYGPMN